MSRHLISATLNAEAYECYREWVKERKASEMISKCIIEQFSDTSQAEQIIKWRKERLPLLVGKSISLIPKDKWFNIDLDDRLSLWNLAKGSGEWGVPDMSWDFRMPNQPHPVKELEKEEEECFTCGVVGKENCHLHGIHLKGEEE